MKRLVLGALVYTFTMAAIVGCLALLNGCAADSRLQTVPCESKCGLRLLGSNDCAGFQAAEDKAVAAFSKHYLDVCSRIYGWNVYLQPKQNAEGWWATPSGRKVRGLTYCEQRTVQIGTTDWPYSSFAHELLHAAECGERMKDDPPHMGWNEWQWAAIREAGCLLPQDEDVP